MCLPHCPEISLGVIVRHTDTLKGVDHSCYVVDAFIVLNQRQGYKVTKLKSFFCINI